MQATIRVQMSLIANCSPLLYAKNVDIDILISKLKSCDTDAEWNVLFSVAEKVFFGLLESGEDCCDRDKIALVLLHILSCSSDRTGLLT